MKLTINERVVHELFGGKGDCVIKDIASSEQMHGKNRCFITITLKPGTSLGVHRHKNESEIYFVLQGRGEYSDNGEVYEIHTGDAVICLDGDEHGVSNSGPEDLVFAALVINS